METTSQDTWNSRPSDWQRRYAAYILLAPSLRPYLREVVRPIVVREADETLKVGSAQVLRVGDRHVLLTAGHNLHEHGKNKVIGLLSGNVAAENVTWLQGQRVVCVCGKIDMTHPESGERLPVDADLAIVEVTEDEARIGGFVPITLDQVQIRPVGARDNVVVFGYPRELYVFEEGKDPAPRYECFPTFGAPFSSVSPDPTWPTRWHEELHIVVQYDRDAAVMPGPNGLVDAKLPYPGGISGCGLWTIDDEVKPFSHKSLRLVGIQHTFLDVCELLIGTDVSMVLQMIAHAIPGASELIRVHGFPV